MPLSTVLLLSCDHVGWADVRALLANTPEVRVLGDVHSFGEARRLVESHCPNVVIAAASLGDVPTRPFLVDLHRAHCPNCRRIILAGDYTPSQWRAPGEAGIVGYLLWATLSHTALRAALAAVLADDLVVVSRPVVRAFLEPVMHFGP